MANSTIQAVKQIDAASKGQSSQGLLIQTYSNSILSQPKVDFSGFDKLSKYQSQINTGLEAAQGHAKSYLNDIQPSIITNVTNINNYYQLHNAVASALPPGATKKEWLDSLNALKDQSGEYHANAQQVLKSLQSLHGNLTSDAASFAKTVSELNAAVNGDNGVLTSINDQLDTIQSKIDGAIAGLVISAMAIIGGVFVTAVGAIADFVTAGASTPVVVGGIALIAAGVGGEAASGVMLKKFNDAKASLLTEKADLTAEVKLATGISSAYTSFKGQADTAVQAASQMENAWNFLSGDLDNLIGDLDKGIHDTGTLRKIFLMAANTAVQSVITDTTIIKHQLTGVITSNAPAGTTIGNHIAALSKQYQTA